LLVFVRVLKTHIKLTQITPNKLISVN
ncbi:hypothetical protein LCGC14_2818450, partial [marine sediment metagenome]